MFKNRYHASQVSVSIKSGEMLLIPAMEWGWWQVNPRCEIVVEIFVIAHWIIFLWCIHNLHIKIVINQKLSSKYPLLEKLITKRHTLLPPAIIGLGVVGTFLAVVCLAVVVVVVVDNFVVRTDVGGVLVAKYCWCSYWYIASWLAISVSCCCCLKFASSTICCFRCPSCSAISCFCRNAMALLMASTLTLATNASSSTVCPFRSTWGRGRSVTLETWLDTSIWSTLCDGFWP